MSQSQGAEQWSRWSLSTAGWVKLILHASPWLYPSKPRYQSGIAKVMMAQQFSPLHWWSAIDSPLCLQCAAVIQKCPGDWKTAEQRGTCVLNLCPGDWTRGSLSEYLSAVFGCRGAGVENDYTPLRKLMFLIYHWLQRIIHIYRKRCF